MPFRLIILTAGCMVLVGAFFFALSHRPPAPAAPFSAPERGSFSLSPTSLPEAHTISKKPFSAPPALPAASPAQLKAKTPAPDTPVADILTAPTSTVVNTDDLYARYQPSVLNIWCVEGATATTGTATIIDPSGILLTSAHIFRDIKDVRDCVLRSVHPYRNIALFTVLFMPTQTALIPGTNFPQNDFALLKITRSLLDTPQTVWPAAMFSTNIPSVRDLLFIFSYATEFVGYDISAKGIPLTSSQFTVENRVTLDENDRDAEAVLLTSGISAQAGSSGGPLVDNSSRIVGIMSFITKGATTSDRQGMGILISFVDRVMRGETGRGLADFLAAQEKNPPSPAGTEGGTGADQP